jgi:hypothetical protein
MATTRPSLIDTLVDEEIERLVRDAVKDGGLISTAACAALIRKIYPTCGFTKRQLADRVILAATAAKVVVEIGRTDGGDSPSPAA